MSFRSIETNILYWKSIGMVARIPGNLHVFWFTWGVFITTTSSCIWYWWRLVNSAKITLHFTDEVNLFSQSPKMILQSLIKLCDTAAIPVDIHLRLIHLYVCLSHLSRLLGEICILWLFTIGRLLAALFTFLSTGINAIYPSIFAGSTF